jgi:glycosyltransferase involved in cell wall biosynthesis
MGNLLCELYGISNDNIIVISNSAFFENSTQVGVAYMKEPVFISLGHLANLCVEKGLDDFIQVCKKLQDSGMEFEAKLAGPTINDQSKCVVEKACKEIPNLTYLGPVYGKQKSDFFRSIDIFIFPSKYKNEAEPLVLYEAAQYGALNIGTEVGCMKDVLAQLGGVSFSTSKDLVENIIPILNSETGSLANIRATRQERVNLFLKARETSISALNHLFDIMDDKNADSK